MLLLVRQPLYHVALCRMHAYWHRCLACEMYVCNLSLVSPTPFRFMANNGKPFGCTHLAALYCRCESCHICTYSLARSKELLRRLRNQVKQGEGRGSLLVCQGAFHPPFNMCVILEPGVLLQVPQAAFQEMAVLLASHLPPTDAHLVRRPPACCQIDATLCLISVQSEHHTCLCFTCEC